MKSSKFRAACFTGVDWQTIISQCLSELGGKNSGANLGLLYVTEPLAPYLNELHEDLRTRTGIQDWIATVGCGICATGREIYDEPAAAIMLADFPNDSFRILPTGIQSLTDMLTENKEWITSHSAHFGIVHGDPRNTYLPQLIETLSLELDPGFLVGGLSSATNPDLQLQIAGDICEGGLSGVLLSSQIPVISGMTQGCTPLGSRHTITKCEHNIIVELDGRPALDVFTEDIGEVLARDMSRVAGYIFAGLLVPGSDTGDYLVRNLVGIDLERKLLVIGDLMEEDTTVMFCKRDGESAREDMLRMLADLKKRAAGEIKGGIYYTCLGRGRYQFGEDSEELKMIRDKLGDFPLVGFFANGEISHNRLYGYTGVLTLFL